MPDGSGNSYAFGVRPVVEICGDVNLEIGKISGEWYFNESKGENSAYSYALINEDGTMEWWGEEYAKWDKTAADEDCFYWASDDPNSEEYGTVIGYTSKIENYTVLRFPSRCTRIEFMGNNGDISAGGRYNDGVNVNQSRAFTNNIIKVELPDSVEKIGYKTFGGGVNVKTFSNMTNIRLSNYLERIENDAFSNCTSLREITIPNSVTSIGSGIFAGCTGLTKVTISNSVTSIGLGVFSECTGLTKITIPNNVTSIESYAFYGCTGLTDITIPNGVTNIGWNCSNLTTINVEATSKPSGWNSSWKGNCPATVNWGYTGE